MSDPWHSPAGAAVPDPLLETAELIWPPPAQVLPAGVAGRAGPVLREFLLVPHARRPRLALPAGAPRAAADVVRKYSQGLTSVEYLTRSVLSGVLGSRAFHTLLRAGLPDRLRIVRPPGGGTGPASSLEAYVSGILGTEVLLGLSVGPSRANRKPVLQAVTPDGQTPAYVKLGIDQLTRDLVRGEAAALTRYWAAAGESAPGGAGPPGGAAGLATNVRVPRVLHHDTWRGLEVLALEAVRPRRAGLTGLLEHRRRRTTEPVAAMVELAARFGTARARLCGEPDGSDAHLAAARPRDGDRGGQGDDLGGQGDDLGGQGEARGDRPEPPGDQSGRQGGDRPGNEPAEWPRRFWQRITETPALLHDEEQAALYSDAIDVVKSRYGDAKVTFGAWHGDWTPWNMVWDGPLVLLWDFERFDIGVPLGLDLAHYRLQSRLRDGGVAAAEALLAQPGWAARPGRAAGPEGAPDSASEGEPNDPEVAAAAYLLELARRWALIAQLPAGGPLRERTAWLLSRLRSAVSPP